MSWFDNYQGIKHSNSVEFISFEEALKTLQIKEHELKRLISEGEIGGFREGDSIKLRAADVNDLLTKLSGGEIVDLEEAELVFDDPLAEEDLPLLPKHTEVAPSKSEHLPGMYYPGNEHAFVQSLSTHQIILLMSAFADELKRRSPN